MPRSASPEQDDPGVGSAFVIVLVAGAKLLFAEI
jgi:hypothetical protein